MKGAILPGHIPVNKYTLLMVGLPPLTVVEASGLEEELQKVEMPDRTVASGGNTAASEFTVMIPMHHSVEHGAMESWFAEGQDPVSPTYKKMGSLLMESVAIGGPIRTYELVGVFVTKRKLPDLEMKNEGEIALVEWTLSVDQMLPS